MAVCKAGWNPMLHFTSQLRAKQIASEARTRQQKQGRKRHGKHESHRWAEPGGAEKDLLPVVLGLRIRGRLEHAAGVGQADCRLLKGGVRVTVRHAQRRARAVAGEVVPDVALDRDAVPDDDVGHRGRELPVGHREDAARLGQAHHPRLKVALALAHGRRRADWHAAVVAQQRREPEPVGAPQRRALEEEVRDQRVDGERGHNAVGVARGVAEPVAGARERDARATPHAAVQAHLGGGVGEAAHRSLLHAAAALGLALRLQLPCRALLAVEHRLEGPARRLPTPRVCLAVRAVLLAVRHLRVGVGHARVAEDLEPRVARNEDRVRVEAPARRHNVAVGRRPVRRALDPGALDARVEAPRRAARHLG
eukprot:831013-Rhodomonas_salina.3